MIVPPHVIPRIIRQVEASEHDSDPASLIIIGRESDAKPVDGAVLVIRGDQNVKWLRELLINQGLLTAGKPIDQEKEQTP
ncbi:MAG: hypothetical protein IT581_06510 [Verrucomicrobiales bacterium]|nr:hypothetical protein [Verrucomicrobiales bacterium]